MVEIYDILNTLYTLLFKYMLKCLKHSKIHIICCITLDQYHPSGPRDDTAYDTDFAMYYSIIHVCYGNLEFFGKFEKKLNF
jgi:hypothetical protein